MKRPVCWRILYGRLATYTSRVYQAMPLASAAKFAIRTLGVVMACGTSFVFTRYWFSLLATTKRKMCTTTPMAIAFIRK